MKINKVDPKMIDHTLLKAFAKEEDIKKLCEEAIKYNFKSVCVNPANISLCKNLLKKSDVLVCTVIGFPLGANTMDVKWAETVDAINEGADEIDMVINVGKAKEHDYDYIENEIAGVVGCAGDKCVKVIIETCYLDDEEKVEVCKVAAKAGARFVKTSTGFGSGGATCEDVKLMKETVSKINPNIEVKASGGVKTKEDALKMIEAGATRIGTSNGILLVKED